MPGLEQREHQTDGKEQPPIHEKDARLAELERAREKSGGQDEQSYLEAPEEQVGKPERHVPRHSFNTWLQISFAFLDQADNLLQILFAKTARLDEVNEERLR